MKKLILVFCLLYISSLFNKLLAQSDSLSDVLPLSIGKEWHYTFYLNSTAGTSSITDTGLVNYSVVSSTISSDSTIWHFFAARKFTRYIYMYPPRYIEDSFYFDIVELKSDRHKLYTPVYDEFSLFPFTVTAPDTESFYRFQEMDNQDTLSLSLRYFTPNEPSFYYKYDCLVRKNIGIEESNAFQFQGFPNMSIKARYHLQDVSTIESGTNLLYGFHLSQNYPNPFNPSTKINYQIPKPGLVSLRVYDLLGREVATLVNEEKPAGSYEVEFNPESSIQHLPAGRQGPASGVYFYRLQAGNYSETKKMIYIK